MTVGQRVLWKSFKAIAWIVVVLLLLFLLLVGALLLPPVQNRLTGFATTYLSEKLGTTVSLDNIFIGLPKDVVLEGLYVEDQQTDTLLYLGQLKADVALFGLLGNHLEIASVDIDHLTANIHRIQPDSTFNFDFIPQAFAGEPDTTRMTQKDEAETGKDFTFAISEISLRSVQGRFDDAVSGLSVNWNIGQLETAVGGQSFEQLQFDFDDISLEDTHVGMRQSDPPLPPLVSVDTTQAQFGLNVGAFDLNNIHWKYADETTGQDMEAHIHTFRLEKGHFDLAASEFNAESLSLRDSEYALTQSARSTAVDTTAVESDLPDNPLAIFPWRLQTDELSIENQTLRLHDNGAPETPEAFNAAHMDFTGFSLHLQHLDYSTEVARVNVENLSALEENSGLSLNHFATDFALESNKLKLSDLTLETPSSHINANLETVFGGLSAFSNHLSDVGVDVDISETEVALLDLAPFIPDLKNSLEPFGNGDPRLSIAAKISGKVGELRIGQLDLSAPSSTRVEVDGTVDGLPVLDSTQFALNIREVTSTAADLSTLLPPGSIPSALNLPRSIRLKGTFDGTLASFATEIALETSAGDVGLNAALDQEDESLPRYTANLVTSNLDLGTLLTQPDSLGMVSLEFAFAGESFNPDSLVAMLTGKIDALEYGQQTYHDLEMVATADQMVFDLEMAIADSLIDARVEACADLASDTAYFQTNIELAGVNLYGMGFAEEDFRASGNLEAEAVGDSFDQLDARLALGDMLFIQNGQRYPMDSVAIRLSTHDQKTNLALSSGPISGAFNSNIAWDRLQPTVMRQIHHYYNFMDTTEVPVVQGDQSFSFDFELRPTPVLTEVLVPELSHFATGHLRGEFQAMTDDFHLNFDLPSIAYNDIRIDSFAFNVHSGSDSLGYRLALREMAYGEYRVDKTRLYGALADQQLGVVLDIRDTLNQQSLMLDGKFEHEAGEYRFSFRPDGIIINREHWSVDTSNSFSFGAQGVLAQAMQFSQGQRSVSLNSKGRQFNAPLLLSFDGFSLQELAGVVQSDTTLLAGNLDGSVEWTFPEGRTLFDADLRIDDVAVLGATLGDLTVKARNSGAQIEGQVDLSGELNRMEIEGLYRTGSGKADVEARIKRLDGQTIAPFAGAYIDSLSGYLDGDIRLSGSLGSPQFTGQLAFHDFGFKVDLIGSRFLLQNESFALDNSGLTLRRFTISDENDRKAVLDGKIATPGEGYNRFKFNLDANLDRFLILDRKESPDALFFGKVMVSSNIRIRGDQDKPVINGSASIVGGSDLSIVIPESEARIQAEGGIDEFVDRYPVDARIMTRSIRTDTTRSDLRGINLRADLSIDPSTNLKIYLDEQRDNFVRAQGDAALVFGIDPSGKVTLTGRYEIASGEYQLVYRTVVRKTFTIQSGSNIVWIGDPLKAQMDITAQYTVRTDPLGLIREQLATNNPSELNRYRQKIPFWLLLNLGGPLAEPEIDFDVALPPESKGAFNGQVQAKLSQLNQPSSESELNKQVFALLVLGQFLPSDPTETSGGGVSAVARSSITRLLNTQLEKLSDKYVQGVNLKLSLDSYEDYSSGEAEGRTELNVGVEKAFLDDRLVVGVGGSIDLEGRYRQQQNASDLIGDISAEYKLTEDGVWRLRGFRKNSYEGIIDGEVTETGASLLFTRSYNKLHELFLSPAKNEEEQTLE